MNPQTVLPAAPVAASDAAGAAAGPLEDRFADTGAGLAPERQRAVIERLRTILPAHCLLYREEDTRPYECDALSAFRQLPVGVALPDTEEQVRAILKACSALDVPVVARGAGTSLSGGS
ncbi:MAG: FAD-binding protein, partial [Burkholderiaceae bacterium]|nr:FAD-binding protein [Burkholderiaceae bacterium]